MQEKFGFVIPTMLENSHALFAIFKKNRLPLDVSPPLLYSQYPIPIKKAKAEDLHKLIQEYVPQEYQSFYAEMPETNDSSSDDDTSKKGLAHI